MTVFLITTASLLYLVGMAVAFGGTLAVALVTAPALFQRLDARRAGSAFGLVLKRFETLGVIAGLAATVGGVLIHVLPGWDFGIRGILLLAAAVAVTALFWVARSAFTPALDRLAPPPEPETEDPRSAEERAAFDALHKKHVQVYTMILFVSLGALVLYCMPF